MDEIDRLNKHNRQLLDRVVLLQSHLIRNSIREREIRAHLEHLLGEVPEVDSDVSKVEFKGLSIVICAYNIPKQIVRTLMSCTPNYQKAPAGSIEVIIVDNGSTPPVNLAHLKKRFPIVKKVIRVEGKPSPVFGLNQGIKQARFDHVAVMIDGAHILSPGIFNNSESIFRLFASPVICIPQYLLGDYSQNLFQNEDAFEDEERKLKDIFWPANGYSLFDYATIPSENPARTVFENFETNCLITTKEIFETYGGFDERFDEPGAGFANLELFSRLTNPPENQYILLPGEGSFHQNHDGISTGARIEDRQLKVDAYLNKYKEITKNENLLNFKAPFVYGQVLSSVRMLSIISKEYRNMRLKLSRDLAQIHVRHAVHGQSVAEVYLSEKPVKDQTSFYVEITPLGLLSDVSVQEKLQYLNILKDLHQNISPNTYFEIGVHEGRCLQLSKCASIGVDPNLSLTHSIKAPVRLFNESSDEFFQKRKRNERLFKKGIDFAFLNGASLSEHLLRDFINTEQYMSQDGVIIIDDILPEQAEMLTRERSTDVWCGDSYKVVRILKKYRPDLEIQVLNSFKGPFRTGMAVIKNVDPQSTDLQDNCKAIEEDIISGHWDVQYPDELVEEFGVVDPRELAVFLRK